MLEEIVGNIIVSVVVGGALAAYFHHLAKKGKHKQDELLIELTEKAEGIRQKLDKMSGEKRDFSSPPKPKGELPSFSDDNYKRKAKKCYKLLEDDKWLWRSDVMLMRKSGLTRSQFDYFVVNTPEVVWSKKPDIYGNALFSLREKLNK